MSFKVITVKKDKRKKDLIYIKVKSFSEALNFLKSNITNLDIKCKSISQHTMVIFLTAKELFESNSIVTVLKNDYLIIDKTTNIIKSINSETFTKLFISKI